MSWVDLKLDDGTVIQYYKKVEPGEKLHADKKEEVQDNFIEVECVILPDDYFSLHETFVLKTYNKKALIQEYNLPRKTILIT